MGKDTEITVVTESLGTRQAKEQGTPCLVVFYGSNIGRRHPLDKPEIILGRSAAANIQVDQESASRQHARISVESGESRIKDLGSTNGTWVNDASVAEVALRDGDLVRVGQTIFKYLSGSNIEAKYHEEIYRLTTIDGLTGAFNKRYFLETLDRELNRSYRYNRVVSLVMFDIDHFKKINDTHGHLAGDYVLRELGQLVAANIRREDIFSRYGGEEFALVLPEIDLDGAMIVCEKLRRVIADHAFHFNEVRVPVTVSLGLCTTHPGGKLGPRMDGTAFISAADVKLYEAKQSGRNRVCA